MGTTADDRLTEDTLCKMLGGDFRFRSSGHSRQLAELQNDAETLAAQDQMPLKDAIRVLSGQTRRAYGTPRPR